MFYLRWSIASIILLFGIITFDIESLGWGIFGLALFSCPFLMQFSKSSLSQSWSIWGGIFLIIQSFVSPFEDLNKDFVTLPKNYEITFDVKDGLPGIHGIQKITTDEKGFRVTKKIDYSANDRFRIFAIGGSTTEDIYLDDRNTWTHRLQELLATKFERLEVINTGFSGLRGRHHLATLKNILAYHPDIVVFLMGINDWNHQIKNHFNPAPKTNQPEEYEIQSLYLRHTLAGKLIIQAIDQLRRRMESYSKKESQDAKDRLGEYRVEYGEYYTKQRGSLSRKEKHSFKPDDVHDEYKQITREISSVCKRHRIFCIFITQPNGYSEKADEAYKAGFWMTPPNQDYTLDFESLIYIAKLYNQYLIRFSQQEKHSYCDIAKDMAPSYDLFIDDCHFNENGTKRFASLLAACINSIPKENFGKHSRY
jgi:lysophospholipase L1-like esterase